MADQTPEQLAERLVRGESLNDIEKQILATYIKQNEEQKKSVDYQERRTRELERELKLLNEKESLDEINEKSKQAEFLLAEKRLQIEIKLVEFAKLTEEYNKAKVELDRASLTTDQTRQAAAQKDYDLALERLKAKNKSIDLDKQSEILAKAGIDNAISGLNLLGVRTEEQDTSLTKMFRGFLRGGDDAESALAGIIAGLKKLNVENVAIGFLSKTLESTITMVKMADTTFSTFNKTIGTTGELNNEIYELSSGNALLGFTLQETAQAYTALAGGFTEFRGLSKENRQELAQTVTELQAIGIGSDIATKNISFFSKAMGLSTEQSISLSKELVAVAGTLEMAPSKIASDFAAAASSLVVYGDRGIEVFKGLESASKASGVEISNLISIASKMDTFQGAAESAGRLNAVLGGGLLNSSQLLMASEEERVRLIVESVQSQGVQFNDLDKYTQKAIASAAGITDMAEANKLFGMSLDVYDDYVAKTTLSSEEQANLEDRIQASKSAQEKFNYIFQSFAVAVMPILNILTGFLDLLMELNNLLGGKLFISLTILTTATVIYRNYLLITDFATRASVLSTSLLSGARYILTLLTDKQAASELLSRSTFILSMTAIYASGMATNLLTTAKSNLSLATIKNGIVSAYTMSTIIALNLVKIAATIITLGLSGALFIAGVAMQLLTSPVTLVTLGILALAAIIYYAWNNFDKFGKIILFILGPIGWLIIGIKLLYDYFTKSGSPKFYEMPRYIAEGFMIFAQALLKAIPAVYAIAGAVLIIAVSMIALFYSVLSLTVTLPFFALALLSVIPAMMAFTAASVAMSVLGGNMLEKILSSVTPERSVGLKIVTESLHKLTETSTKLTPANVKNVKDLVDEVERYNLQLLASTVINISAPIKELIGAITGQTNAVMEGTKDKTIVLKVGEREMGKIVLDTINRKGNIDTAVKSTSTVT
jgi:hypothetical protein